MKLTAQFGATQCYVNLVLGVVRGLGDTSKLRSKASMKLKESHSQSLGVRGRYAGLILR